MKRKSLAIITILTAGTVLPLLSDSKAGAGQRRAIDGAKSVMTVRVYKGGALAAFGHDHEISAPIAEGSVDTAARQVELRVNAKAMRVRDPKASDKDRAEVQQQMLGPEILDSDQYPRIEFRSTSVEQSGSGGWQVHGTLNLRGQSRPVTVAVSEKGDGYAGSAPLRLSEFGIKPKSAGAGTVKVKDEIRIEFDIQLAK